MVIQMETKYGLFPDTQFDSYKQYLHSKIHWLLIYKDSRCNESYQTIDVDKCFTTLQVQLTGLNSLLNYPSTLITLMTLLESAKIEQAQTSFNFNNYRKLLLDAHRLVDLL